ncbi:MAG: hypothetical protein M3R15_06770 [Acidobacteriota bacterium]|nr:hypothetical protein [Acidobacteriota bacterium]
MKSNVISESVPHPLVRREVEVRLTAAVIEIFDAGRRVASHPRSTRKGAHSTQPDHMPKARSRPPGMVAVALPAVGGGDRRAHAPHRRAHVRDPSAPGRWAIAVASGCWP